MKGALDKEFSLEEWIDTLFLLPEQDWAALAASAPFFPAEAISTLPQQLKSLEAEALIEQLQSLLQTLPWMSPKGTQRFLFQAEKLWGTQKLVSCACNEEFLQMMALLTSEEKEFLIRIEDRSPNALRAFLFLIFLTGQKEKFSFFSFSQKEAAPLAFPEKYAKLAESYGRESLKLCLLQQQKCEESSLQAQLDYLKHLWNLFKTLYEQGAFPEEIPEELRLAGKEFWMLSQWWELEEGF